MQQRYPLPQNEDDRLKQLLQYEILDTEAEAQFDDLVKLASAICEVPISLISLVDFERQWFKAKVGLEADETHRNLAFCAHAIMDQEVMEVEDATKDERFFDNDLVTGAPDIRFYAGMPLTTPSGHNIGTLCVIDTVPRKLTDLQRQALQTLSKQVVAQMELRLRMKDFKAQLEAEHAQKVALRQLNAQLSETMTQLEEAHANLQASEEEMRQQAEELLAINDALNATNQQLTAAKNQLVQSEKLASLGQMTAGVAHEINNPVNFISGGLQTLEVLMRDVAQVMNAYDALDASTLEQLPDALREVARLKQECHYDELREDIRTTLEDMKTGVHRTSEIVRGLRTFARQDLEERKMADVHECIHASIVVLSNKAKDRNVELVSDLDPGMSPISCYPGQLNQVFLNLISNALDATPAGGRVVLRSRQLANEVQVSVQDTGMGIAKEIIPRIFDPFFTTKDVGKGTGLGLSISYGVVERHGGRISVESEEGKGSVFTVSLPKC